MIFQTKPVATIKAKTVGSTETTTINGVTTGNTTPENAASQINKVLNIVGKEIGTSGMIRVQTEEAVDNG